MSVFSVDTSALRAAASQLASASTEYERIYKQLIQTATTLGAAYESADNKVYVSKIEGCCAALQAMANELMATSNRLNKMAQNYDDTQEHNTAQANRL